MSTSETQDEKDREHEHEHDPIRAPSSGRRPAGADPGVVPGAFPQRGAAVADRVHRALPRAGRRDPRAVPRAGRNRATGLGGRRGRPAGAAGRAGRPAPGAGGPSATAAYDPAAGPAATGGDSSWPMARSGWATTASSAASARGAWAWSTRRCGNRSRSRVALKVMHPRFRASADYLRRFHNEARSAAQLHHTNIVSVFDYGEHDGVCYYAMQYIAGHSLDEILADVRRLRSNQGQEKAAPVEAGPDPNTKGHPAPPQAVHDAAQTEAAADPLMRTVTHGLLTGQFAKGTGVALDLEEARPRPPSRSRPQRVRGRR